MIVFGCTNHGLDIFYNQIVFEKQKTNNFIRARKLWNTNRVYDYENFTLTNQNENRPAGVILNERLNFYKSSNLLLTVANAGFFNLENIPFLVNCWKNKEVIQIYRKDVSSAIIEEYVLRNLPNYENELFNFSVPTKFINYMVKEIIMFKTLSNLIENKISIIYEDVINYPKLLNDKININTTLYNYVTNKPNFITSPNRKCINYNEVINLTKNI